jgi:hypothetical protein
MPLSHFFHFAFLVVVTSTYAWTLRGSPTHQFTDTIEAAPSQSRVQHPMPTWLRFRWTVSSFTGIGNSFTFDCSIFKLGARCGGCGRCQHKASGADLTHVIHRLAK